MSSLSNHTQQVLPPSLASSPYLSKPILLLSSSNNNAGVSNVNRIKKKASQQKQQKSHQKLSSQSHPQLRFKKSDGTHHNNQSSGRKSTPFNFPNSSSWSTIKQNRREYGEDEYHEYEAVYEVDDDNDYEFDRPSSAKTNRSARSTLSLSSRKSKSQIVINNRSRRGRSLSLSRKNTAKSNNHHRGSERHETTKSPQQQQQNYRQRQISPYDDVMSLVSCDSTHTRRTYLSSAGSMRSRRQTGSFINGRPSSAHNRNGAPVTRTLLLPAEINYMIETRESFFSSRSSSSSSSSISGTIVDLDDGDTPDGNKNASFIITDSNDLAENVTKDEKGDDTSSVGSDYAKSHNDESILLLLSSPASNHYTRSKDSTSQFHGLSESDSVSFFRYQYEQIQRDEILIQKRKEAEKIREQEKLEEKQRQEKLAAEKKKKKQVTKTKGKKNKSILSKKKKIDYVTPVSSNDSIDTYNDENYRRANNTSPLSSSSVSLSFKLPPVPK